jgi:hypothetical protein
MEALIGPLIRPLIEVHRTRMVAEINGVASAELDLHRHLFGSDLILPPRPLRDGIAALQDGRCFYCHGPLGSTPRSRPLPSRGSAAASTRWRTWSWPTGGVTTTSSTCSPAQRTSPLGPAAISATTALTALATGARWDTDPAPPQPRRS